MNSDWKPLCSLQVLKQRAFLLSKIRQYFASQNVLEVETPILSSSGNTDINIASFTSEKIHVDGSISYLRTSPEFPLKRLLSCGSGDIYEIGKVFRRGEMSKTHNSEFTMLEWYRVDYDYNQLIQDVIELFSCIFTAFEKSIKAIEIITFNELFNRFLSIDIYKTSEEAFNQICHKHAYSGSYLSKDESLDYLFATQIQPHLDKQSLTFVTLYPATQAALSQINPDDNYTSLRFEVFYQGHELGNGYQELTIGSELFERFKIDNIKRTSYDLPQITIDNYLIDAMNHGMPDCSGIAVGLDRLLMVLLDGENINELLTFNAINS
jgi:lysyl-tRNA synthetase class 2